MAYATGIAANRKDVLVAIRDFSVLQGWVVEFEDTTDDSYMLVLQKNGYYMTLWESTAQTRSIGMRGSMQLDWTADRGVASISGSSTSQYNSCLTEPFVGWELFGDDTYIHMVLEVQPNAFTYIMFGWLDKQGDYTGGEYYSNTYWAHVNDKMQYPQQYPFGTHYNGTSGCVRSELDNADPWALFYGRASNGYANGGFGDNCLASNLVAYSPSAYNATNPLIPLYVMRNRPGGLSMLGTVPDVRFTNFSPYLPKEELVITPDTWRMYPQTVQDNSTYGARSYYGYALRRF